jgi:hypothetical protein
MGLCASSTTKGRAYNASTDEVKERDKNHRKSKNINAEAKLQTVFKSRRKKVVMEASNDAGFTPDDLAKLKKSIPNKSPQEKEYLANILAAEFFMFNEMEEQTRKSFINFMECVTKFEATRPIIKQGDIGDYMYIVEDGTFDVFVNKEKVASLGRNTIFGELALLCKLFYKLFFLYFFYLIMIDLKIFLLSYC